MKLGFFESDSALRYQDEINGPLIRQVPEILEVLQRKYLKAQKGPEEQELTEKSKEKSKEKILRLLSESPRLTAEELGHLTGLSLSGVERNLRELKKSGSLRRVGPDKGGHWEVIR